jgi:hypothetical protein
MTAVLNANSAIERATSGVMGSAVSPAISGVITGLACSSSSLLIHVLLHCAHTTRAVQLISADLRTRTVPWLSVNLRMFSLGNSGLDQRPMMCSRDREPECGQNAHSAMSQPHIGSKIGE